MSRNNELKDVINLHRTAELGGNYVWVQHCETRHASVVIIKTLMMVTLVATAEYDSCPSSCPSSACATLHYESLNE